MELEQVLACLAEGARGVVAADAAAVWLLDESGKQGLRLTISEACGAAAVGVVGRSLEST